MRIAVIILGLLVAGCTTEESIIEAQYEYIEAQEQLISVLEIQVKLLKTKCNVGHEI